MGTECREGWKEDDVWATEICSLELKQEHGEQEIRKKQQKDE